MTEQESKMIREVHACLVGSLGSPGLVERVNQLEKTVENIARKTYAIVFAAAGGSGIVIISSTSTAASTTGSPTVTTNGSNPVYTFTSTGSITF